jgi:VanZ family protein
MIQRISMVASWLALVFIVCATLSPLQDRPAVTGPQLEHFAAFALMGLAFAIAYPSRIVLVFVIVIGSSFALEALQLLTPDRHARMVDALVKAAGGVCGIGANIIWSRLLQERILRLIQRAPS